MLDTTPFLMLDAATFLSPWYWAFAMALWGRVGAGAYGVPAHLLHRALRKGGEDAAMADRIARDVAAQVAALWPRWGLAAIAVISAALAALAVLALVGGAEAALGILLIAAPMAWLAGVGIYEALLVHKHQPGPDVLLEVIAARRRMNLTVGTAALAVTAVIAVLSHQDRVLFFAPI